MQYIVDTNFFLTASKSYYPMDVFHGFWKKVAELANNSTIISIDKVRNEIFGVGDDLERWCIDYLPHDFFHDSTVSIMEYQEIVKWANSQNHHYKPAALNEFLSADEADAWLVSYAKYCGVNYQLTTYEISDPNKKNKIKIPEAANHFNVPFVNPIGMFRELGLII